MRKRMAAALCALTLLFSAGCSAMASDGGETPPPTQEAAALTVPTATEEPPAVLTPEAAFYPDVDQGQWYYPYIRELYEAGVLPGGDSFGPGEDARRIDFVLCLYRLHLAAGGGAASGDPSPFADVPAGSPESEAAAWARQNGVAYGVSETEFSPDGALSREQACAFAVRFAAAEGLELVKTAEAELFPDSGQVSDYARGAMAVCQMAGVLAGDNGRAEPDRALKRGESAAILCRLRQAAVRELQPGQEAVALSEDACAELYRLAYVFGDPIPESSRVDPSWFGDAAFVGDSITVGLEMYNTALEDATFLCTTSLSAPGALAAVTSRSKHPEYNGKKMRVEDAVAACGAKNVYILLGINNMYSAVETSTASLAELIGLIKEKCPQVNIIVQSVTPLTATSTILADNMNNWKIDRYNEIMRGYCAENGWYYLDVASAVKNANGDFDPGCCGDAKRMGIHFSKNGVKVWEEYLFTHVPEALK